jgi:hypothetical protein
MADLSKYARLIMGVTAVACGASAGPYVPGPYDIEEEFDKEYAMDLFQLSYDRDWDAVWAENDIGMRLAMGSLNVRQWHLDQEVKFAAEFTDWFRFLYRYDRYEGLEPLWDERQLNEMELEFRLWRWFKLGLRTQPTFWKRYADGGFTAKFDYGPGRYVEAGYTAIDFDNNYSFRRSDYDEGYEEMFEESPQRYEAAWAWSFPWGISLEGEGFWRTPSGEPGGVLHRRGQPVGGDAPADGPAGGRNPAGGGLRRPADAGLSRRRHVLPAARAPPPPRRPGAPLPDSPLHLRRPAGRKLPLRENGIGLPSALAPAHLARTLSRDRVHGREDRRRKGQAFIQIG